MTLSEAKYGQEVQIKSINQELLKRIQPMGFYSGAWLKIEAIGLLNGPMLVQIFHDANMATMFECQIIPEFRRIKDAKVMLSQDVASLIEVE